MIRTCVIIGLGGYINDWVTCCTHVGTSRSIDTCIDTSTDVSRDVGVAMMHHHHDTVRQRGCVKNDWASRTGDRTTMATCLRLVSPQLFAPRYVSCTIVVGDRFTATTL
jgi:hypothetical protein